MKAGRQGRRQGEDPDARRHGRAADVRRGDPERRRGRSTPRSPSTAGNRFARLEMPASGAVGGPQRPGRRVGAPPDRRATRPTRTSRSRPPASTSPARSRCRAGRGGSGTRWSCWSADPGRSTATRRVAGIPVFAQLAGALAERGFMVAALRPARRRAERRPDRDGHAPGLRRRRRRHRQVAGEARRCRSAADCGRRATARAGRSAMLAAAREKKIASLVLIAAAGIDRRAISCSSSSAINSTLMKLPGRRAPAEDRPAAEGARRGADRQGLGGGAARRPAAGRDAPGSGACSSSTRPRSCRRSSSRS